MNTFTDAMLNAGIVTRDPIIDDGRLHRIHVEGDKRGTKNGAYILFQKGGWFQHWNSGVTGKWSANGKNAPLSKEIRAQIEVDRKQRQIEMQQRHNETAKKAQSIWFRSLPVSHHPYLTKKKIQPHNALSSNGSLVIPIYAPTRELVNLQFIDADGNKRFLSGGKKKGCFSVIRNKSVGCVSKLAGKNLVVNDSHSLSVILLCEGFATGASLYESTGHMTVIAMDAGNLEPVAIEIKRLYPASQIIICGDNDASGIGQLKAKAAAMAVFGKVLIPETVGFDWNDELTNGGV
ncbi:MAG: toprim domain-containing protein [Methylococcaceae bacterium]